MRHVRKYAELAEHRRWALTVREIRRKAIDLLIDVSAHSNLTSKETAALRKMVDAIDKVRSPLENKMFSDLGEELAGSVGLIYYGPERERAGTPEAPTPSPVLRLRSIRGGRS